MKPRIKKVNGLWKVNMLECTLEDCSDGDWLAYVAAYNFCIMLNNRK